MEILITAVVCFILGALVAYPRGQQNPDWFTKRQIENDAARIVLAELTDRPWVCEEKLSSYMMGIARDRGRTCMVVAGTGLDKFKLGDPVKLEIGSSTPFDSISSYRMKFGEILRPVRVETAEQSSVPAKKPFDPVDSLVRAGVPG